MLGIITAFPTDMVPNDSTAHPHPRRGTRSTEAGRSVNSRWTDLILCGINGDGGTRNWKDKTNKQEKINLS